MRWLRFCRSWSKSVSAWVSGTDVSRLSARAFALASGESVAPEAGEAKVPETVGETTAARHAASSPPELSIVGGADMDKEPVVADIPEVAAEELQLEELEPSALGEDPFEALTEFSGQTDNAAPVREGDFKVAVTDEPFEHPEPDDEIAAAELSFVALDDTASDTTESVGISFEPASDETASGTEPKVAVSEAAEESILTDAQAMTRNSPNSSQSPLALPTRVSMRCSATRCRGIWVCWPISSGAVGKSRTAVDFDEGVRRAMHTLRGSSRTAGVPPMAELAGALEDFSNGMSGQHRQTDSNTLDMLDRSHRMLSALAATVEDPHVEVPDWEALRDEIRVLVADWRTRVPLRRRRR